MRRILIGITILMCFMMNDALAGSPFGDGGFPRPECVEFEGDLLGENCQENQCTQQDLDEKEPDCACASAEELEKLIAVHEANINTIAFSITALKQTSAGLTAAMNGVSSRVENFEYEIGGRCLLAGIEGYGVGKLLTTYRAACGHVGFAAQCKAAGFTNKEIAKYLVTKKSIEKATEGLIITSLTLIAKHGLPGEQKPWYYNIPLVGGWCGAYSASKAVFTAPQVLDELGRNRARVTREIIKLNRMLREEQEAIQALKKQIADACNDPAPMFP
ncbi:MAG: hypothetical protein ACJZ7Z_12050 [Myxococcota bacterium]